MLDLRKYFPFLKWIHEIKDPSVLRADTIAGITVALVLIPQSMAYAQLAGLPAHYGLYISFMPVVIAALWGSSRQLATGPVAIVSILTATAISTIVGGTALKNPEVASQYIAIAMFLALIVGIFQFLLGALRLGKIVNFLSHPVIVGFTNAAALVIALSQLSKLFGVEMPGGATDHFLTVRIWGVLQQLGDTHLPTLIMGGSAFAIMMALKKYYPRLPCVLIAVVITTLISWMISFESGFCYMREGIGFFQPLICGNVIGEVPAGLPEFSAPNINLSLLGTLLPSAILIALVGFMEAISIAKAMAAKTKHAIDPNQELIGQGIGNIVGSFSQAYPSSGSFSRSAVNLTAGAKTGFSSVVTAVIVLITLLFLTPLLYHLPTAVLAAVIMLAVFGLISVSAMKHAWLANKHDGIAAIVTFVATLGFAPHLDQGIMIGAGLSIILYLYRTMKPRVAILARYVDGTLRDLRVHPDLPTDDKVVAIRFDGSLYFANVSYFEDTILAVVADKPNIKFILVVGDAINQLDASGEAMIHRVVQRLYDNGIIVMFSGLKKQILEVLRRTGEFDIIGEQNIHATADMALASIYEQLELLKDGDEELFCPLKPGFNTEGYKRES